jgi:glycosyltransferase involved in cell wall biosynthesis
VLRAAFARYDAFVANSEASRAATVAFAAPVPLHPFAVIPNGVDAADPPPPSAPRDRLRVGFIGRNDPAKGFDVFLDALELLGDEPVDAVAVGHGVPELVEQRGLDRVEAHGRCADAWGRLGTVDVLVVPSRSEGSPNVVLEAFVRCVPVISTDAGGAGELAADGRGTVVPSEDPPSLAAAIRRARLDPDRGRGGAERARNYVVRAHAWRRVVAAYDALLREIASD